VRDQGEEEEPEREQERHQTPLQQRAPEAVTDCSHVSLHLNDLTSVKRLGCED
jgi:hypothetical protein